MKTLAPIPLSVAFSLMSLALACSSSGDGDGDDSNLQGQAQNSSLTCVAGEMQACACLGQTAMGVQSCNATGNGYGSCLGCPSLAPSGASGSGGDTAGAGGSGGASPMTDGTLDAGKMDAATDAGHADAALREDSAVSLPAGAEPGVSCGVGLPALCDLDTQKCCVRSLQTDSCIAVDATCDCPINGCRTMEARCDRPRGLRGRADLLRHAEQQRQRLPKLRVRCDLSIERQPARGLPYGRNAVPERHGVRQ